MDVDNPLFVEENGVRGQSVHVTMIVLSATPVVAPSGGSPGKSCRVFVGDPNIATCPSTHQLANAHTHSGVQEPDMSRINCQQRRDQDLPHQTSSTNTGKKNRTLVVTKCRPNSPNLWRCSTLLCPIHLDCKLFDSPKAAARFPVFFAPCPRQWSGCPTMSPVKSSAPAAGAKCSNAWSCGGPTVHGRCSTWRSKRCLKLQTRVETCNRRNERDWNIQCIPVLFHLSWNKHNKDLISRFSKNGNDKK